MIQPIPPQDARRSRTRLHAGPEDVLDGFVALIPLENGVSLPQFEIRGAGHV
ncbi:hypothetical protein QO034_16315 [Sedimentitalea sp. JM2-8]|uniref:Uncharacterized protein n=1 Tax=Sedimentitalea xiamensis TaxID=3050037 RepID=A0ABT7FI90_9RHOB|nr:hypothetical protein [Sedimentitalea xiamensis]MDK3074658.1 hypothetical protein [Sedimentitalea xiamensis]